MTEDDIARGRVRLPAGARALLPARPSRLTVEVHGRRVFDVPYEPGDAGPGTAGPVLRPGTDAMTDWVRPGTELLVFVLQDGSIALE